MSGGHAAGHPDGDYRTVNKIEVLQFPPFGPEHLINSLHHLAELVSSP